MNGFEFGIAALIGLAAGVIGGMAGIGGSLIMLPGLALLLGYQTPDKSEHHIYMAAAMCVNFLVAAPAAYRHHQAGAVRLDVARVILPVMGVTILLGVWLSDLQRGHTLKLLLAGFIAFYCLLNLFRLVARLPEPHGDAECAGPLRLGVIGAVSGVIAGLLGIGGGVMMVPALQLLCRLQLRQAIATSSAVMCLTAIVGAVAKLIALETAHQLPISEAFILVTAMGPTAIVGAAIGARLTHALPLQIVRGVISVLLLIAAARMAGLI